jgi:hypothetical protein
LGAKPGVTALATRLAVMLRKFVTARHALKKTLVTYVSFPGKRFR